MKKKQIMLMILLVLLTLSISDSFVRASEVNRNLSVFNSVVNQTNVDAPKIDTIYNGDTTITGVLPKEGLTDEGVTIPIIGYTSAAWLTLNGKTYSNDAKNQLFNYKIVKLEDGSYAFTFTLPDGLSFKTGDKLNRFLIPADLPEGTPQLSQKFSSEVTVVERVVSTVTVHYQDINGNPLSEDKVLTGNVGTNYTTEQKSIDGYTLKEVQGNATGKFTDQAQTVTYIYSKNKVAGGDVTAKYVNNEGNTISEDVVKSGDIGDDYATEQKTVDGYTFKEVQGSAIGKFTDQAQTVTYIYTKNPVLGGDITVKYVDTKGKTISSDVIKSGNVGENYTTEQKTIDGYTFKEIQGVAIGQFSDQAQTITYVYTKNIDPTPTPTTVSPSKYNLPTEVTKTLPQTGENPTFTIVASIFGSLLLGIGLVLSLLRARKIK
ncbi:MucBP domain-containing protein [Lactococcus lactis]|uniref:MucBP domain-containing protein n=1 Tax=Lactococcus lactis TaxID=1358 RepID=UPI002063F70C|nr:MucBP domain-containing protein [Lactococcus lactis]BDH85002.1 hypothetical protein LLID5_22870 [Lactococcus lactis]